MSLPQNWKGIFWGKETQGDLLFDCTPEEFAFRMEMYPEQGSPAFFIAGACVDFIINREDDRAQAFFDEGKKRYPKEEWCHLEIVLNKCH